MEPRQDHRHANDHFVQSAELYDLLSEPHWQARRASFGAVLDRLGDARVVLDIGTGTGPYLAQLAAALPAAQIHAIEPSASMRVGLMSRILADASLRRQVTVHPVGIEHAALPDAVDFAMVCGCIGFLGQDERVRLWRRLAVCLSPDGAVLADVMPVDRPQVVEDWLAVSTTVGMYRYDVWLSGAPVDEDVIRWTMRFEQWSGALLVRRFQVERNWCAFGLDRLMQEAAWAGFRAEPLEADSVPAAMFYLSRSERA